MPLRSDSGRRHRRSSAEFYPCQSRYQRLRLSSSVSLAFILHVSLLQNCSKGPPAMAVDDFRGLFAGDMGSSTGLFPFGDIYYQMQSLWCYLDSTSQWVHAAVSFHRVSSIASGLTCLWQGVHPSSAGHLLDDAKCSNQVRIVDRRTPAPQNPIIKRNSLLSLVLWSNWSPGLAYAARTQCALWNPIVVSIMPLYLF